MVQPNDYVPEKYTVDIVQVWRQFYLVLKNLIDSHSRGAKQ